MRLTTGTPGILIAALAAALPFASAPAAAFELSVVVNGRPLPEYWFEGRTYVEARKGCEFTLQLRNSSAERVAVALSVDGRNVIDAKRTTAGHASKWILAPFETVEIPGWQVSGETARRFFFTDTSRSYAKWLGDTSNTGVIEAVFFRERRVARDIAPPERPPQGSAASPPEAGAKDAESPAPPGSHLQRRKADAMRPSPTDELAATGIGERTDFRVRRVPFDAEPVPAARARIRYEFRAELVRLGVLPPDRDLFGRERSRGFEPDYAPDPYRDEHRHY